MWLVYQECLDYQFIGSLWEIKNLNDLTDIPRLFCLLGLRLAALSEWCMLRCQFLVLKMLHLWHSCINSLSEEQKVVVLRLVSILEGSDKVHLGSKPLGM